jgi:hypothetical protein
MVWSTGHRGTRIASCGSHETDNDIDGRLAVVAISLPDERISPATDASRAALQETINEAMHTNVMLADDALTDSSVLTIELNPPGTMQDPVPLGRDMGKPIQFRLVLNQEACILIDQRDGTRHVLNDTTCVAD